MAQNVMLRARGLHTFYNSLSEIPEGALIEAKNVVIDRNGVIQPRRGFKQFGSDFSATSTDRANQLFTYKDRILLHYEDKLAFDSTGSGNFSDFFGTYTSPSNFRIRNIEANGNFYFTSDEGIKKISAESNADFSSDETLIRPSGGVKALDLDPSLNAGATAFLDNNEQVAYRVVWGYIDNNNVTILGFPSSRTVIANNSGAPSAIDLSFVVPDAISESANSFDYFYQVYRTAIFATGVTPDEEYNLVIEEFPSSGTITNYTAANPSVVTSNDHGLSNGDTIVIRGTDGDIDGLKTVSNVTANTFEVTNTSGNSGTAGAWIVSEVTTTDITPDSIREGRAPLYTNEVSGEGIENANERPPLAKDIASYKGYTFYANTQTIHRLTITLLSGDSSLNGSSIDITDGTTTNTYTFAAATDQAALEVGTSGAASIAEQIDETARELIKVINRNNDGLIYGYYDSGATDAPGIIRLEARTLSSPAISITASDTTLGNKFIPTLPTSGTSVKTDNEVTPNRLYYSKFQQPEAVPLVNFIDVGPQDESIRRIVALRDSLFIFKTDGLYRLTGETDPFQVALFDSSAIIKAPDSAAVLNNRIYALTEQGVITATDTGVSVISRPIEDKILSIFRDGFNFAQATFGVSYETDRAYHLWTVTSSTDTNATQCFRYNTFTGTWVRWEMSKTCGIVNRSVDKMYLGASDEPFIEQERKSRDRTDYADRDFTTSIVTDGVDGTTVTLASLTDVDVGDVILQQQKLTIAQYNQLLKRLDLDPFINDTNYFSTLEMSPGGSFTSTLASLTTKMDADSGLALATYSNNTTVLSDTGATVTLGNPTTITSVSHGLETGRSIVVSSSTTTPNIDGTYTITRVDDDNFTIDIETTSGGTADWTAGFTSFAHFQSCYNAILSQLDRDAGAFYSDYFNKISSSGAIDVEAIVLSRDISENQVTVPNTTPFITGISTVFNAIDTRITWAPQIMGDPTLFKQVSEGTILFQDNNFSLAAVSYSTDLSPGFEEISFTSQGIGDFGQFPWNEQNWGGIASAIPLRTLVPRQKQRCRFVNCRFEHMVARESYDLYGISLTFRPYSTKAYK